MLVVLIVSCSTSRQKKTYVRPLGELAVTVRVGAVAVGTCFGLIKKFFFLDQTQE